MKDLANAILSAQNFDENSMYKIIKRFDPIICKYARKMKNDEDFKSDMILRLIEVVRTIDLSKFNTLNDYAIINYINKVLYHQYIYLSKKHSTMRQHENSFECDDIEEWIGVDYSTINVINNFILDSSMKSLLTEREYLCVKYMVLDGMSSSQAGKILGVKRQTVNEAKIRGLNKLKKHIINH